jgi:hypothetical protein
MKSELFCNEPTCNFNLDAMCIRGTDPGSTCPLVSRAGVTDSNGPGGLDLERPSTASKSMFLDSSDAERRTFYSGEALSLSEATEVLRDKASSVVVLAGGVHAGKTTLIAEIYQMFLKGPVGDLSFAGSKTLMGFERRSFLARVACDADIPDTERTYQSDRTFLHLMLRNGPLKLEQVLMADIAGEVFERLSISASEASSLNHIARADHVAILIPCDKLVNFEQRHKARDDAIQVMRRFLETKLISSSISVQVIFSKIDFVRQQPDTHKHEEFIDSCQQMILEQFSSQVRKLRFFRVDARADDSSNLVELLRTWRETSATKYVADPVVKRRRSRHFLNLSAEATVEGLV